MDIEKIFGIDLIPSKAPFISHPVPFSILHAEDNGAVWCYRRDASNAAWVLLDVRSPNDHAYIDPILGV